MASQTADPKSFACENGGQAASPRTHNRLVSIANNVESQAEVCQMSKIDFQYKDINLGQNIRAVTANDIENYWEGLRDVNRRLACSLGPRSDNAETCSSSSDEYARYFETADQARDRIDGENRDSLKLYKIIASNETPFETWQAARGGLSERLYSRSAGAEHTEIISSSQSAALEVREGKQRQLSAGSNVSNCAQLVEIYQSGYIEADTSSPDEIPLELLKKSLVIRNGRKRSAEGEVRVDRTHKSRVKKSIRSKR